MAPLDFLQSWYLAQTNGAWEHVRGITIETLNNAGWMVTVDLIETPLQDRTMTPLREDLSPRDWLACRVERNQFCGQGDGRKLSAILEIFQRWAGEVPKVE